jgi:hypothetical protein
VVSLLLASGIAQACPKCRVATAELESPAEPANPAELAQDASTTAPTTGEPAGPFKGFSVGAGVDFPTAYYFRGYLQQDRGVIIQPFVTLSAEFEPSPGVSVQPYIGMWNSFHTLDNGTIPAAHSGGVGRRQRLEPEFIPPSPENPEGEFIVRLVNVSGDGQGWYEADLMAGVTLVWGDLFLDVNYHWHIFPDDVHDMIQEVGGKLTYDVAGFWDPQTPASRRRFSLRPGFAVYFETSDQNGGEETWMEASLEPAWRFTAFGQRAAVSAPLTLTGSPDGYYVGFRRDEEESIGYFSAGLKGSIALPIDDRFGDWYLNASLTYLHLIADGLQAANRGERDEIIGSIGIGVAF